MLFSLEGSGKLLQVFSSSGPAFLQRRKTEGGMGVCEGWQAGWDTTSGPPTVIQAAGWGLGEDSGPDVGPVGDGWGDNPQIAALLGIERKMKENATTAVPWGVSTAAPAGPCQPRPSVPPGLTRSSLFWEEPPTSPKREAQAVPVGFASPACPAEPAAQHQAQAQRGRSICFETNRHRRGQKPRHHCAVGYGLQCAQGDAQGLRMVRWGPAGQVSRAGSQTSSLEQLPSPCHPRWSERVPPVSPVGFRGRRRLSRNLITGLLQMWWAFT